jgi:hypothetical protein
MSLIGNSRASILLAEFCLTQPNSDTIKTARKAMEVINRNYLKALILLSLLHSEDLFK